MDEQIEILVSEFGEQYRKLIIDSLEWLASREGTWKLDMPIDRHEFISGLIEKASKDKA